MLIGLVIHVAATNVVSVAANIERGDSQNSNQVYGSGYCSLVDYRLVRDEWPVAVLVVL